MTLHLFWRVDWRVSRSFKALLKIAEDQVVVHLMYQIQQGNDANPEWNIAVAAFSPGVEICAGKKLAKLGVDDRSATQEVQKTLLVWSKMKIRTVDLV